MENKFHDFSMKNININKAFAYADSDMNIITPKENFRRFFGVQLGHSCLYKIIDEQAGNELKEKLCHLKIGEHTFIYAKMPRVDGQLRDVSLKITYLDKNTKNNYSYSIEMIDIFNAHSYIYDLEFKTIKYKNVLDKQGNMLFEYNASTDILKIYSLKYACEQVVFSCNISEFKQNILDIDICDDDKRKLMLFCSSLQNNENYIEYSFSKNPFIKNANDEEVTIRGNTISLSEIYAVTVGSINNYSGNGYISGLDSLDMMTGLLNKNAILELAKNTVNEKVYDQVFLVMLDLDNFKLVNDTYGHMKGDEVIKKVAEILKAGVKQNGWVGRFGGDEYFAVLYNLGSEGDLRAILGAIQDGIESCYRDEFDGFNLSCSMGISEYPRNGNNFDLLFKKADRGLYIAKRKGKKRYIIYKEELHGELSLEDDTKNYKEALNTQKFAGDIRRYKLMRDGISSVAANGIKSLDEFMNDIIEAYCLTGISVYTGDNFKLFKQWGNYSKPMNDADYMNLKNARQRFNDKVIFWENNVRFNGNYIPAIHDKLLEHNINSTVQGIIGKVDNIKGIVTFDAETPIHNWTEEDTNYFGIVSQLVGSVLGLNKKQ